LESRKEYPWDVGDWRQGSSRTNSTLAWILKSVDAELFGNFFTVSRITIEAATYPDRRGVPYLIENNTQHRLLWVRGIRSLESPVGKSCSLTGSSCLKPFG
jgi:hypothetical protein